MAKNKGNYEDKQGTGQTGAGNRHRNTGNQTIQYTFLVTNVVPLRMEKDRSIKILRRHGHVATLAVHYFSNNFNGLESHLKTLFRFLFQDICHVSLLKSCVLN